MNTYLKKKKNPTKRMKRQDIGVKISHGWV